MDPSFEKPGSFENRDWPLHSNSRLTVRELEHQHSFSTHLTRSSSPKLDEKLPQKSSSISTVSSLSPILIDDVEATSLCKDLVPRLPAKRQCRLLRNVRHKLLSVYKRLFSVYVLANVVALIVLLRLNRTITLASASNISTAISANVLVAALARTECVVNLLFTSAIWIPQTASLRLRRILAKVYEYGGIHSGAGLSATLWMSVFTIQMTRAFFSEESFETAILVLTYLLFSFLVAISVSAFPSFRRMQHNSFEAIHRFAAWISISLYWALIMTISSSLQKRLRTSFGHVLIVSPSFWILCALTFLIILPWLHLRKVRARSELLSNHAIKLHFDYTKVGPCQGIRISSQPLLEWHSFATVPSRSTDNFSILISNAGDWTKANIQAPAPEYWVKGIPITGFLRVVQLFQKVVIVTTGSGIGPCLSGIIHAQRTGNPLRCRLLWSTRDPDRTYGKEVVEEVLRADPQAVIVNTRPGTPRPDLVALTYQLYAEFGAEAVFVISNPKLTRKVKYGMESRGIPAYGPVFDS